MSTSDILEQRRAQREQAMQAAIEEDESMTEICQLLNDIHGDIKRVYNVVEGLNHSAPARTTITLPKPLAELPAQVGSLQQSVGTLSEQIAAMGAPNIHPPKEKTNGWHPDRGDILVATFFLAVFIMGAFSVWGALTIHAQREETRTMNVLMGRATAYDSVEWYKDHYLKGVRWGQAVDEQGNPILDENGKQRPIYDIPGNIKVEQWKEVQPQLLAIYNATGETEAH